MWNRFNGGNKFITLPRDRCDELVSAAGLAEGSAEYRDILREVALFNDTIRPHGRKYFVFSLDLAAISNEKQKQIKDLWRKRDRVRTLIEEETTGDVQSESVEFIGGYRQMVTVRGNSHKV